MPRAHPRHTIPLLAALTLACLGLGLLLLQSDPASRAPTGWDRAQDVPEPQLGASPAAPVALEPHPDAEPSPEASASASAPTASRSDATATRPGARQRPLPTHTDGTIDFAALGLTGKEAGAELLRTEEVRREAQLDYAFRLGDAWVVETYYRNMQTGTGDSWSDPVFWHFEVVAEAPFQGQDALVVRAAMRDAQGTPAPGYTPATLYVARDGYHLLGAELTEVRGGKRKQGTVTYGDQGGVSRAVGSIVPFDLPPQGVQGRVTRGAGLPSLEPVDARSRGRFPGAGTLLGAGQDYVEIEFETTDGSTVRQRWSLTDLRWPTETITEHWRSYRRKLT